MKTIINEFLFKCKFLWKKYVLINTELSIPECEVREKYIQQRKNNDWTLYSERTFIEQLFSTRFNYYIASFSLLTAAISRIESETMLLVILSLSAIILTLMSLTIYRIYVKLIIILRLLYKLEDYQVFRMIDKEIKYMKNKISIPVNAIIGVIIPFLGSAFFVVYLIKTIISLILK